MKKLILLIVLITNFCMFNVSYSEAGNTHTGQDVITAGMPTMGQIKYCINQPSASKCPPGNDGKNINSGYIDCSGFSTWVYGQIGIKLSGGTNEQQAQIKGAGCKMSTDWKNIKAGDLIYYKQTYNPKTKKKTTGHVVMATEK